jgi:hypothetical protein
MLAAAWQWAAESPLSGEGIALPGFMAGLMRSGGSSVLCLTKVAKFCKFPPP